MCICLNYYLYFFYLTDEGDMSCNNTSCTSKTKKKFKKLISFQNYIPRRKTFEDQINLAKGGNNYTCNTI